MADSTTSSVPVGSTGAGGGNTLRITGLNTGLDIDAMVKKMLTADQSKVDQAKQAQQLIKWRQEAYQSIIKDIKELQSAYFDVSNSANYLLSSGSYNNMVAVSADATIVGAKASATAAAGNYKIAVSKLAQVASISSSSPINSQVKLNTVQGWSGKTITFNDGTDNINIEVDSSFSGNIDDLVTNLNDSIAKTSLKDKLSVVNDNGKIKFQNSSTTIDITLKDGSGIADIGTGDKIISKNSSYETQTIENQNFSNWKNTIKFSIGDEDPTTETSLDLSGFTGTTGTELVSYINSKISENSDLNGKLSASYVKDEDGNEYIKFVPTSSAGIKISDTGGISDLESLKDKNLVSTSLTTKLTSLDPELKEEVVINLKYNGKEVSVSLDNSSGSATVGDLITSIKNATGGAVTGKFDDMTGKFTLQTTATGSTSSLQIETNISNPTEENPSHGSTTTKLLSVLGLSTEAKQGSDAVVTITEPGSSSGTTLTQSSNNFTVNGVTYSITGVTAADSPVNISITKDTSKVHDLITNFIDKYNDLIGEIQDKLAEKKDYDYKPLTDTQKSSMSDTDITNWETKAKQGILRNDDNLQQLLDNLTSAFTNSVVDSSGKSVSTLYFGSLGSNAIGIDFSDDYTEGSKIVIKDEQKFTEALNNNADEIIKLFTTTSDSTDAAEKFNQSGIFQRISQVINNNVGMIGTTLNGGILTKYANLQDDYSITGGSGTGTLPDQIYQKQLIIDSLTETMNANQTKYYNQFTQLEVAMEKLNAQQSTLAMYLS